MAEISLFFGFGLIILVATALAYVFRLLRQPLIIAYLVTGIIFGSIFLSQPQFTQTIEIFSQLGIAFLLFLVGLNLNPKVFKEFGIVSVFVGLGQMFFTFIFGLILSIFFGFDFISSMYIAIALTFSSTIIVVKFLSDKKELESVFGRISVGALIVQDFAAIAILLLASSIQIDSIDIFSTVTGFLFKAATFSVIAIILSKLAIQKLFKSAASNQELLFLSAISWCLILAGLAQFLGFSIEAGAFIAGISIASFPYNFEIGSKMKNLRDFFLVLFFVFLGSGLALGSLGQIILPAILFSAFVLLIQPLILLPIMLFFGYKARISFLVAMTIAQISEFSLILVHLGQKLGHIPELIVSLMTATAIITMGFGTILLYNSNTIYEKFFRGLKKFEKKSTKQDFSFQAQKPEIVFFGFGETGKTAFLRLEGTVRDSLIIDFDPQNVSRLGQKNLNVLFADAQDAEVVQDAVSLNPKTVLIATDSFEANTTILKAVKMFSKIPSICVANTHGQAKILYSIGAAYVIVPKIASSEKTAQVIQYSIFEPDKLSGLREQSLNEIRLLDKDF